MNEKSVDCGFFESLNYLLRHDAKITLIRFGNEMDEERAIVVA